MSANVVYKVEYHNGQWIVLDERDQIVASGLLTREVARKIAKRLQGQVKKS